MNVFDALFGDTEAEISIFIHSATNSLAAVAEIELRNYRMQLSYADHRALRATLHQIVIERTIAAIKTGIIGGST